jgi:hypothetical protein
VRPPSIRPRHQPAQLPTVARALGAAGAIWGLAVMAVFVADRIDSTTLSVLHNAGARRGDIGYALAAIAAALAALVAAVVGTAWFKGWLLAGFGVAYATLAAEAVAASTHHDRLGGFLLLAVAPSVPVLAAAVVWAWAVHLVHALAVVGLVTSLVVITPVLGGTVLQDNLQEVRLFAGHQPHWMVEHRADNAFVDGLGRVWGVQPWRLADTAALHLRDPLSGRFEVLLTRPDGWPPSVIGTDAGGRTWLVSSELADPFAPVFDYEVDGHIARLPGPDRPLPPLDAVALDTGRGNIVALHSDLSLDARAVLEIHDAERGWRTVTTPVAHPGRTATIDIAVDRRGAVVVWHEGRPDLLHRYDGTRWERLTLPFAAASITDAASAPIALDPFRAFVPGVDAALRLHDPVGGRLVTLDEAGAVSGTVPLRDGVPLAVDSEGRVWVRGPRGLVLLSAEGEPIYDSAAAGLPSAVVESVAVGEEHAWLLVRRGRATTLLRFDHGAALSSAGPVAPAP